MRDVRGSSQSLCPRLHHIPTAAQSPRHWPRFSVTDPGLQTIGLHSNHWPEFLLLALGFQHWSHTQLLAQCSSCWATFLLLALHSICQPWAPVTKPGLSPRPCAQTASLGFLLQPQAATSSAACKPSAPCSSLWLPAVATAWGSSHLPRAQAASWAPAAGPGLQPLP